MELLLAMAIIMILSVIGIGSYTQSLVKSKDMERKNDLNQIAKGLELYYNDAGKYPTADNSGRINCGASDESLFVCTSKLSYYFGGKQTVYMDKLPTDSDPQRRYFYKPGSDYNTFALYASLANPEDKDIVVDGDQKKTDWSGSPDSAECGPIGSRVGGVVARCNYKITETGLVRAK